MTSSYVQRRLCLSVRCTVHTLRHTAALQQLHHICVAALSSCMQQRPTLCNKCALLAPLSKSPCSRSHAVLCPPAQYGTSHAAVSPLSERASMSTPCCSSSSTTCKAAAALPSLVAAKWRGCQPPGSEHSSDGGVNSQCATAGTCCKQHFDALVSEALGCWLMAQHVQCCMASAV
jgi:hypothetical protein